MSIPKLGNLVPYLFCSDIEAAIDWYVRVFGFVERERWRGPDGAVENAELLVGDTELWLDAGGAEHPERSRWIGVVLDDRDAVDAMHAHVLAEGVEPEGVPVDRPFGIRTFDVKDPEGHTWGFFCRIPPLPDPPPGLC